MCLLKEISAVDKKKNHVLPGISNIKQGFYFFSLFPDNLRVNIFGFQIKYNI